MGFVVSYSSIGVTGDSATLILELDQNLSVASAGLFRVLAVREPHLPPRVLFS